MKKLLKIALLLGIAWVFIACGTSKFSENSPIYYDESTQNKEIKQGACALRFNTRLDLSQLTQQEKEMYWSRIGMAGNPDFCYKGKVVQTTNPLREVHFNIPCSCVGQRLHRL